MAANGVVVWEWQNEYSNWQPYSPQISTFIESHQSSGQPLPLGQVDSSLYLYTVDVANMCQTRQGIGTTRAVRRTLYPSTSPVAHGITWQWEADVAGKWNDFDLDVASYLEECMNKNVLQVDLNSSKFMLPYYIDLKNLTQTRLHTGRVRKIRRTFTTTSYPFDTNSGNASSSQNGMKRKTVINKNASSKKSKASFPSLSMTSTGFVPPMQSLPINGLVSLPSVSAMQGALPQPAGIGMQSVQGPVTRNRYNQTVSAFSAQSAMQNSMPGGSSSGSIPVNTATGNQAAGNQLMFGGPLFPATSLPYLPSSLGSQTGGFGFPPTSFPSYLPPFPSQSGNQPYTFGSQPGLSSFNPAQLLSRSRGSRVRPSNPVATNVSTAAPTLVNPLAQQTPFQSSSSTVPSATPFPKHARIPNNVPKGGKGGKQVLSAEDILHNYVTVVASAPVNEDCCICYERLTEPSGQGTGGQNDRLVLQLEKCSHMFHKLCLDALYNSGPKEGSLQCPSCKAIYGEKVGNCPRGEMEYLTMKNHSLAGYEGCDTIQVLYHIQPGVQGPEHPHPGKRYSTRGFPRIGYLPDNEQGRKVLQLLIIAWKRRLTFTIGMSTTTGEGDTVTWNEIHHKTEHSSNYSGHGYPDPNYLDNVLLELAVHGITEKDLPS